MPWGVVCTTDETRGPVLAIVMLHGVHLDCCSRTAAQPWPRPARAPALGALQALGVRRHGAAPGAQHSVFEIYWEVRQFQYATVVLRTRTDTSQTVCHDVSVTHAPQNNPQSISTRTFYFSKYRIDCSSGVSCILPAHSNFSVHKTAMILVVSILCTAYIIQQYSCTYQRC